MLILIGLTRVVVNDGPFGVIEREPVAMDGTREVYILRVHEIALVKEPCFYGSFCTQEHKTAAEVRCVYRSREIEVAQFVVFVAFRHHPFRQKAASEDIKRRRKPFG